MTQLEQCFFNMYKMDYDFGWYGKDQMRNLVVQGFLSPENYQKIVGEAYERTDNQVSGAPQA